MAIKISTVIIILVASAALAQNGYTGYDYRVPSVPPQLSSNLRPNVQQYSHAHELQNRFLPSPVYHQHYAEDVYKNQQTQQEFHNNQGHTNVQSTYQNENYNSLAPNFGSGKLTVAQNVQETVQASPTHNPSFSNFQPQPPVIMKHIYFHLPPPDTTASTAPLRRPAPKKTYNIMFIKLPSQKSASVARLQQLVSQQAAAAESKTLIYVLVKKPETQPIEPVTSKPEVFFVKYKEPRNIAQPVNSGLVQVQAPQSSISGVPLGQIINRANK